jgi:hypothetical protein
LTGGDVIQSDLLFRVFRGSPFTKAHFCHGLLDAIQIAVALGLKSQGLVEQFVAADKVLCEVATLEGFAVLNPEHP